MRFSIFSLMRWPEDRSQRHVFQHELDQLSLSEAQGYHCAWLAERAISPRGIGPAIHLAAANLAARTRAIRIGTVVTILPFMHPLRVAEEVAMLDILSEGRIEWGIGCGEQSDELPDSDTNADKRQKIFHEQLEIIQQAWTGEPFAHAGEFYQFDELQCFPHPVQQPRPPVHIAGSGADTIEWAAHNHYPVLWDAFSSAGRLQEHRQLYLEAAATVGVDASTLELPTLRQVYVADSIDRAREEAAPALLACHRSQGQRDPESFLQYLFEECAIIGDAAYCRDRIAQLEETLGLSQLITWQNFGNLSHGQALASQERFITQVAPAFA